MRNSLGSFKGRIEQEEKLISELKGQTIKTIQSEEIFF